MEKVMVKTFHWDDDEVVFNREFLVNMVGQQLTFLGMMFEINIIDPRFDHEYALPWDATATLNSDNRILLSGMTEPSGGGFPMTVLLPKDVFLEIAIYKEEDEEKYFVENGTVSNTNGGFVGYYVNKKGETCGVVTSSNPIPWDKQVPRLPRAGGPNTKIGQKVLYQPASVDQWKGWGTGPYDDPGHFLKEGEVYTIKKYQVNPGDTRIWVKECDVELASGFNSVVFLVLPE